MHPETYEHAAAEIHDGRNQEILRLRSELAAVKIERNDHIAQSAQKTAAAIAWRALAFALGLALVFFVADTHARSVTYHGADLVRVIDGDTYDFVVYTLPSTHGTKRKPVWEPKLIDVRLDYWDTPEHRGQCEKEKTLARLATSFAKAWFERAGSMITIRVPAHSFRDAFGRTIAAPEFQGQTLGGALAAAGLARPFKRGRNEGWCDE